MCGEGWLDARVLCGWKDRSGVLVVHGRIHPPSHSNCTLFCLGVQFVPKDLLYIPNSQKILNVRMKVIFGGKSLSSLFRVLRQELTSVTVPCDVISLPQQKVRKIDHVQSTCVLVGLKDVQRFSVHLLLVSFGHYRPLAASQVTGRKDMEVPHKFTQS